MGENFRDFQEIQCEEPKISVGLKALKGAPNREGVYKRKIVKL
jgi:hypothetical protein